MPEGDEHSYGRRPYDDAVSAAVRLAIAKGDEDTRHALRSEIATVAARQEAASARSAAEYSKVQTTLTEMHADMLSIKENMVDLKQLEPRVQTLEQNDAVLAALASNRKWLLGAVAAIVGALAAATSVILTNLPH